MSERSPDEKKLDERLSDFGLAFDAEALANVREGARRLSEAVLRVEKAMEDKDR